VDPRGDRSPRPAARRGLQLEPQEPDRADGHADRRLPGKGRRRRRLQRPPEPVLGGRRVHAELDVPGPLPGHHGQDRRAAVRGQDRPGAHLASTWDNKKYGLPFIVDLSVWFYNKALYRQAGLDPEKPPTTLEEFATQARAVGKLGNGIHGTFFGGNCGGCEVFTWWPIVWADGEQVMNPEGTQSMLNSPTNKTIYSTFRSLVDDGSVWMPDSKTETGPTWTGYFLTGKVGIMPWPATLTGVAGDNLKLEDVGATPIAGTKAGTSTFVGGDSIGIGRDSKVPDQAWNFLAWLEDQDAQVNVIAKGGNVVSRTDLATNQYSSADPRLVMFNTIAGKGQTPFALKFGQTYNDPQGPWLVLLRDAVFGDASKIDADNDAINASLQP